MITIKSYIEKLCLEPNADNALLAYALEVYGQIMALCPALSESDAALGENSFMLVWDLPKHYLECEIFSKGGVEFFYRNRLTGQTWGSSGPDFCPISPNLQNFLKLFKHEAKC